MHEQERLFNPILLLKEELQILQTGTDPSNRQDKHPTGQGWQISEESS